MAVRPHISVLGGGPAGLASGGRAPARPSIHGVRSRGPHWRNCTTLAAGGFRYDSGAHRLHDRDPEVTAEMKRLLGDDLRRVDVPSQIWTRDG